MDCWTLLRLIIIFILIFLTSIAPNLFGVYPNEAVMFEQLPSTGSSPANTSQNVSLLAHKFEHRVIDINMSAKVVSGKIEGIKTNTTTNEPKKTAYYLHIQDAENAAKLNDAQVYAYNNIHWFIHEHIQDFRPKDGNAYTSLRPSRANLTATVQHILSVDHGNMITNTAYTCSTSLKVYFCCFYDLPELQDWEIDCQAAPSDGTAHKVIDHINVQTAWV